MPALRLAVVALVALVASGASAVGPEGVAHATPPSWTPPSLPPGAVDPFDAYTKTSGGYSSADLSRILKDRIWYAGQIEPHPSLDTTQRAYRASRFYRFQSLLRLRPALSSVTTAVRFACVTPATCTVGAALLAGGITYTVVRHFTDSAGNPTTATEYVTFTREHLGGAYVTLPATTSTGAAMTEGTDWKVAPDHTGSGVMQPFGWRYRTGLNTSVVPSGAAWVFNYAVFPAFGYSAGVGTCTSGGGFANCYPTFPSPLNVSGANTVSETPPGVPSFGMCLTSMSQCIPTSGVGGYKTGARESLLQAADLTVTQLAGQLVPLRVKVDEDMYASGHLFSSTGLSACTGSLSYTTCRVAYIPDTTFERAGAVITQTAPSTTETGATTDASVASDAGNSTDRAKLPPDTDTCARAAFNELIDPANYAYYGCDDPAQSAEDNSGTPLPAPADPPTTLTLPKPNPNETGEQYRDRLESEGHLGTITITELTTEYPGYGPDSPVRIVVETSTGTRRIFDPLRWPATGPAINTDDSITIRINPPTAPEVPNDPENPSVPGDPGDPDDCVCPTTTWDLSFDLDASDRIPFGIVTYVRDTLNSVAAEPVRPALDVPVSVPTQDAALTGTLPIECPPDRTAMCAKLDTYMAQLRTIEGYVMWFLGFVWLAHWWLRISNGRDDSGFDHENLDWRTGESKNSAIRHYERGR